MLETLVKSRKIEEFFSDFDRFLPSTGNIGKCNLIEMSWLQNDRKGVYGCVHTMPAHFEKGKNVTDRPPVHTKMAHFCRQISKTVDFENGTLTGMNFCRQISKTVDFENGTLTGMNLKQYRVNTRQ